MMTQYTSKRYQYCRTALVFVILIYNAVCLHKVIALPFMRQHSRPAGASSLYRSVIISRIAIAARRYQTRLFPTNN